MGATKSRPSSSCGLASGRPSSAPASAAPPSASKPAVRSRRTRVFFVRHAQGYHNVKPDWDLFDPALTELGEGQARSLRDDPRLRSAQLVVVSPHRRTLQTALTGCVYAGTPVVAHAGVMEIEDHACNYGEQPEKLRKEWPGVDFGLVREDWWLKRGANRPSVEAARRRFAAFTEWLAARDEEVITVVAHFSILRTVLGLQLHNAEVASLVLSERGEWLYADS